MTSKAAEKLVEALTQLMAGYQELQESLESEYSEGEMAEEIDEDTEDLGTEVDAAIITEIRAVLENVMDVEDYSTEEVATALSTFTEALEELDPDVFERDGEEEIYVEDDDDDDDSDFLDDDDDDLDFEDDYEEDYDDDDEY